VFAIGGSVRTKDLKTDAAPIGSGLAGFIGAEKLRVRALRRDAPLLHSASACCGMAAVDVDVKVDAGATRTVNLTTVAPSASVLACLLHLQVSSRPTLQSARLTSRCDGRTAASNQPDCERQRATQHQGQ